MSTRSNNKRLLRVFTGFTIWGSMTVIWAFVWYKSYADIIQLPFYRRGNWVVIGVYAFLLYIITQFYGGYRVGYYRRGDLIFSGVFSMFITNFITYFQTLLIWRQLPSLTNVRPFLWMTAIDFILIWVWASASNKLYITLNPPRHLLMVYGGSSVAVHLVRKIVERDDRYIIQEAINVDEGMMKVIERVENFNAILLCDVKSSYRNRLLKHCFKREVRVYMTPKISDILIRGADSIHLFDSPLLFTRSQGLSMEKQVLKRAMDILLSLLGILIFSPFMLGVSLFVKLSDRGSILYKQTRLTIGGREFSLYKFRSMVPDAEKQDGVRLASEGDSRITPVGRVIRKFRLDELPQLFNILLGDMSLVGPRPERPEIAAEYCKSMPEFDMRLKVKAGLTGYAQVLGKYNTTPYDKLKLDLMYITGYSFLMDIKLLLMTIKIIFMTESTEGISDESKTAELKTKEEKEGLE